MKTRADWNIRREEIKSAHAVLRVRHEAAEARRADGELDQTMASRATSPCACADDGRNASFAARLTLPTAEQAAASGKSAPFPVIVSLDYAMNNGNANYLDAGYAVLSLPTAGVQSDNVAHTGAIFDLYPYDVAAGHDFGCLVGWAWGASRAVDALEYLVGHDATTSSMCKEPLHRCWISTSSPSSDSRAGARALCSQACSTSASRSRTPARPAAAAPRPIASCPSAMNTRGADTSGSEVLGDHLRHQTHNSNEMMRRFLNDTIPATVQGRMYQTKTHGYGERLPFDHHLEIAAIAPRAVLIANTNDDYGNNAEGDAIGYEAAMPVFEYLGAGDQLALDIYMGGGGHSLKVSQQHNFVRFLDFVLYGMPLPGTAPPGDATHTATDVQLRKNPYLTGAEDGSSVYDIYYGGLKTMMPWRSDRAVNSHNSSSFRRDRAARIARVPFTISHAAAALPLQKIPIAARRADDREHVARLRLLPAWRSAARAHAQHRGHLLVLLAGQSRALVRVRSRARAADAGAAAGSLAREVRDFQPRILAQESCAGFGRDHARRRDAHPLGFLYASRHRDGRRSARACTRWLSTSTAGEFAGSRCCSI